MRTRPSPPKPSISPWLLLMPLVLAPACLDPSGLPELEDFPPAPRVAACLVTPGDPLGSQEGVSRVEGIVQELGRGDAPDECFRSAGSVGQALVTPEQTDGAYWIRGATASGQSFVVGVQVEGARPPDLKPGDVVSAVLARTVGFGHQPSSLELIGGDARLLAWVSNDLATPPTIVAPKLGLERAALEGREPRECGWTDLHDVLVRIDNRRGAVLFHSLGLVADLRVANADYSVDVYPAPDCPQPSDIATERFLVAIAYEPPKD